MTFSLEALAVLYMKDYLFIKLIRSSIGSGC